MIDFITTGGPFMWFILLLGVLALLLTASHVISFINGDSNAGTRVAGMNTVLYLGIAAFLVGITAQLTGLFSAANVIIDAGSISPTLLAKGVLVSFHTTLLGLYVLVFSFLFWLGGRFFVSGEE